MPISFYPGTMILMTDGTVLVHYVTEDSSGSLNPSGIWMRLTPDAFGNYSGGTWSQLPTMPSGYAPALHATAILPDGRLLVEGGEYNEVSGVKADTGLGAIYDPASNSWTNVNPPHGLPGQNQPYYGSNASRAEIGDAQSVVLPDGQFMLGDFGINWFALFDANNLSWTSYLDEGKDPYDYANGEEGWTLLPSGKVLTVDLWGTGAQHDGAGTTSMLYDPSTNSWSPTGNIPVSVEDSACTEIGPMVLRRDGTVTAIGGNGQLATYSTSTGTWSAGPLIGGGLGVDDGPGVLLPDGNVFFKPRPGPEGTQATAAR